MNGLSWDDLNVKAAYRREQEWRDRSGRLRVHVSVKGAAFVGHTFWIKDFTPDKPETRAAILLEINRALHRIVKALQPYVIDLQPR